MARKPQIPNSGPPSVRFLSALPIREKTADEICREVAADFKRRGISQAEAALRMGVAKRAVSNQISGKRAFVLKTARLYALAFGYNEEFLLKGKGSLFGEASEGASPQTVTITLKQYTDMVRENAELKTQLASMGSIKASAKPRSKRLSSKTANRKVNGKKYSPATTLKKRRIYMADEAEAEMD